MRSGGPKEGTALTPLYREDLDSESRCIIPGCNHTSKDEWMYLHARCHREAKVWAKYRNGVLSVECGRCHREVVSVNVAAAYPWTGTT
jgi:hypothetical protein